MPSLEELKAQRDVIETAITEFIHEINLMDNYETAKNSLNSAIKGIYDGENFRIYADENLSAGEKAVIVDLYNKMN